MASNRSLFKSLVTFCALTILITPYWSSKALAQENSAPVTAPKFKVTFNPPAGDRPKTNRAGASRSIGQCINQAENSDLPFSPVLPVSAPGLTAAAHPTVLAYLPQTSAKQIFFSWRDDNNNEHYQTILPLTNQGGVISLTLPEDAPALEVGKNYQWALAIMCDGKLQPDSPMIQGQIRRVAITTSISDRLQNASLLEAAAIYGEAGIWYETVATLAQLKTAQPSDQNLASNWSDLLTSVGLENISQVPTITSK